MCTPVYTPVALACRINLGGESKVGCGGTRPRTSRLDEALWIPGQSMCSSASTFPFTSPLAQTGQNLPPTTRIAISVQTAVTRDGTGPTHRSPLGSLSTHSFLPWR